MNPLQDMITSIKLACYFRGRGDDKNASIHLQNARDSRRRANLSREQSFRVLKAEGLIR